MNPINLVRWVHIISGVAWLGEVTTINIVLVPALLKMSPDTRRTFIRQVFPRVFHLATVLALTALVSGAAMSYLVTGWRTLGQLLGTRWGNGILIGGSLGLLLALFHFFVESKLEPIAVLTEDDEAFDADRILTVLKVVPKVGMGILALVILLMMYAARGL